MINYNGIYHLYEYKNPCKKLVKRKNTYPQLTVSVLFFVGPPGIFL
jgi:hypothetical protein